MPLNESGEYVFKPFSLKEHDYRGSDEIPQSRSGHRIVSDRACVYSFGGYNSFSEQFFRAHFTDKIFKELWKFNIAKGEWKELQDFSPCLPEQGASNAVMLRGNSLIVHGGTGLPFGYSCTNDVYIANLKDSSSFELVPTTGQPPIPMYGQAMLIYEHYLYVYGGTTGTEFPTNVHRLDLKTKTWEEVYFAKKIDEYEPPGRYRHEVALYDSKMVVFGGGTDSSVYGFQELPAFNLETWTWESMKTIGDPRGNDSYPARRRCHGGVQIPGDENRDSEFVICGGTNGIIAFSDMWKINLRTLQWTKCDTKLVRPLYFHATTLTPQGQMFIHGGVSGVRLIGGSSIPCRRKEMYSTWVLIPKLKEICWEALLSYNPNLVNFTESLLLDIGIPKEFVVRLQS